MWVKIALTKIWKRKFIFSYLATIMVSADDCYKNRSKHVIYTWVMVMPVCVSVLSTDSRKLEFLL